MDMLGNTPLFELDNKLWPIHSLGYEAPAAKILKGEITNSMIAEGTVIKDARIRNSVIRSGVIIEEGVNVEDCIILDHSVLTRGCRLRKVIVDKLNILKENDEIGFNPDKDRFRCHIDPSGIAILPRGGSPIKVSE
jgi:glucose-1-phosphate adenylyltransferase